LWTHAGFSSKQAIDSDQWSRSSRRFKEVVLLLEAPFFHDKRVDGRAEQVVLVADDKDEVAGCDRPLKASDPTPNGIRRRLITHCANNECGNGISII